MMGRILCETTPRNPRGGTSRRRWRSKAGAAPHPRMLARAHMLAGRWETADSVLDAAPARGGPNFPATARMCLWTRDVERARRLRADPAMQTEAMWSMPRVLLDFIVDGVSPSIAPRGRGR